MRIPITKTVIGPEELKAIQEPLSTGWIVQGPFVKKFEEQFSSFTSSSYSIATTSCTTALHTALAALGVRPGDEVIVPAFTWVATPNVVEYMGARPIFADIDPKTFNIDTDSLEELITPKTAGIIPVHLFGLCADMPTIQAVASEHRLWVVEDAACGFGAWYQGKHAGTWGDLGCFSFHPRKAITTGEGGMITTHREDLDRQCRSLRDHGASRSDLARHQGSAAFLLPEYDVLGFNYRMTDLQAALGCAQMLKADWILAQRRRLAERYLQTLREVPWLHLPQVPKDHLHGWQSFVCRFGPKNPSLSEAGEWNKKRNRLMSILEQQGIATRQGTHAPVLLGYYTHKYDLRPEQYPHAILADHLSLTLPLYPQMTEEEQDSVINALRAAVKETV